MKFWPHRCVISSSTTTSTNTIRAMTALLLASTTRTAVARSVTRRSIVRPPLAPVSSSSLGAFVHCSVPTAGAAFSTAAASAAEAQAHVSARVAPSAGININTPAAAAAAVNSVRPSAFGLHPRQYRTRALRARQFSAGGNNWNDAHEADVAAGPGVQVEHGEQEWNKEDKYPTLTRAALSNSEVSSRASLYTLPPPAADVMTDLEAGRRIVTFGDVHGDIDALKNFLVTAQIMDESSSVEEPVWSGGDTICVQVGDILDRGDDELACFRLLTSLSRQAREAGGELIMLYGNHEALNCVGLFQYANPGGNYEFEHEVGVSIDSALGSNRWRLMYAGNQPSRWAAFEPGGLLAENLLANMKVAVVVGRTVFVHAGLTASHVREYGSIETMNQAAADWVLHQHHGENDYEGHYDTVAQVVESAQKRARGATKKMPNCLGGGSGEGSPVWMRDYSSPNDGVPKSPKAQQLIDEALEEVGYGVQRMVMGHTPQHRINAALKGRAWRVDVGASRGVMAGQPEVLEIIHGGDGEDDIVNILTMSGEKVASSERQVIESIF